MDKKDIAIKMLSKGLEQVAISIFEMGEEHQLKKQPKQIDTYGLFNDVFNEAVEDVIEFDGFKKSEVYTGQWVFANAKYFDDRDIKQKYSFDMNTIHPISLIVLGKLREYGLEAEPYRDYITNSFLVDKKVRGYEELIYSMSKAINYLKQKQNHD